jgi:hypothetical protein
MLLARKSKNGKVVPYFGDTTTPYRVLLEYYISVLPSSPSPSPPHPFPPSDTKDIPGILFCLVL